MTKRGAMENELWTVAEVAAYLRVDRTVLWHWRKQGHIPEPIDISPPNSGRPTLRFQRDQILALARGQDQPR
jgi:predicted DNA-binding transcriptional regulator AlpA